MLSPLHHPCNPILEVVLNTQCFAWKPNRSASEKWTNVVKSIVRPTANFIGIYIGGLSFISTRGGGGWQNCTGGLRYFRIVLRGLLHIEKPFEGGGGVICLKLYKLAFPLHYTDFNAE